MKILLDQQLSGLDFLLRDFGRDIITPKDIEMVDAKDKKLINYAKANNCIFVTENNDAAQLAKLNGGCYVHLDIVLKAKAIESELKEKFDR